MSIRTDIFYPALQQCIDAHVARSGIACRAFEVNGATVGECLRDLTRKFPGAEMWLFDHKGQLREEVFVYINAESSRKAFLSDPIREKDRLIIALMIMGGLYSEFTDKSR